MRCAKVKRLLDDYREGELREPVARDLQTHLAGCARCTAELTAREKAAEALRGWERAEASDALTESVVRSWQALRASPQGSLAAFLRGTPETPKRHALPVLAWAGAAAACAVVAVLFVIQEQPRLPRSLPPTVTREPSNTPRTSAGAGSLAEASRGDTLRTSSDTQSSSHVTRTKSRSVVRTRHRRTHWRPRGDKATSPTAPVTAIAQVLPTAPASGQHEHRLSSYVQRVVGIALASRFLTPALRDEQGTPAGQEGALPAPSRVGTRGEPRVMAS